MKALNSVIFSICNLFAFYAYADMPATMLTGDVRLVQFEYNEEMVYPVLTRPLAVTNIIFPKGEKIRYVMAGDSFSFIMQTDKSQNELFIKPKFEGIETTLTVATTNKRFQFVVRSTGKNRKYYQQVSFAEENNKLIEFGVEDSLDEIGPSKSLADLSANQTADAIQQLRVNPSELNTTYTITGEAPFKPEVAYDNGKFVWIKFPKNLTELPAIFAKDNGGMYLVNYIPQPNNVIVVQQMVEELILKIENTEVSVRRGKKGFFGWSN